MHYIYNHDIYIKIKIFFIIFMVKELKSYFHTNTISKYYQKTFLISQHECAMCITKAERNNVVLVIKTWSLYEGNVIKVTGVRKVL